MAMSEREQNAVRQRASREKTTIVVIPKCENKRRRKRLEKNDAAWLRFYFGPGCELEDVFTYEFTSQQQEMIRAISESLDYGLDQAIAASRGEGKSTITERIVLKKHLEGKVDYSVILQATGPMANGCIDSLKHTLENNPLLVADYPEVCVPVIALEGAPQRAQTQKVSGFRYDTGKPFARIASKFTWSGDEIIFPNVPGSPSAKSIITSKGLESAVRGLRKRGKRPKLAVIDDPDTEETAASVEQAKKLEKRIDSALALLGGQKRKVGRVIITTIQSNISVSFKYTDPKQKPSMKGKRFRFLVKKPDRLDLWDDYVQMWKDDQATDPFCRRAYQFYLDNRKEMDLGSEVSNPNRFDDSLTPAGSPLEASALQRYFNTVAQLGQEYTSTELDNDPPEDTAFVESGLSPRRVQTKTNGYNRRIVPPSCVLLTQGIDCRKSALHWVIRAWMEDGTGYTIDYGIHEVRGTIYGSDDGVDVAIQRAILERIEATRNTTYFRFQDESEAIPVDLTLVDAGYQTDAVYGACYEAGAGVMPIMGFGKSAGCTQANFHDVQKTVLDKQPGDGWFLSRKGRVWLVCADADRWKQWEHNRWLTSEDQPGCMTIFGQISDNADRLSADQKDHHSYSRHICNEKEVEKLIRGVVKRVWSQKSDNNHWFDASYYSDVAASMRGIKLGIEVPSLIKPVILGNVRRDTSADRRSLSQMRKGLRR
jgi:hypothetical protein